MVHFKRIVKKSGVYLAAYNGNKFLQYVGREDKATPEKLNYIRRKLEKKVE